MTRFDSLQVNSVYLLSCEDNDPHSNVSHAEPPPPRNQCSDYEVDFASRCRKGSTICSVAKLSLQYFRAGSGTRSSCCPTLLRFRHWTRCPFSGAASVWVPLVSWLWTTLHLTSTSSHYATFRLSLVAHQTPVHLLSCPVFNHLHVHRVLHTVEASGFKTTQQAHNNKSHDTDLDDTNTRQLIQINPGVSSRE